MKNSDDTVRVLYVSFINVCNVNIRTLYTIVGVIGMREN